VSVCVCVRACVLMFWVHGMCELVCVSTYIEIYVT
jgi:hypothetical protein